MLIVAVSVSAFIAIVVAAFVYFKFYRSEENVENESEGNANPSRKRICEMWEELQSTAEVREINPTKKESEFTSNLFKEPEIEQKIQKPELIRVSKA